MQRWQLTTGLAALAVTAAFLAPRLAGHTDTAEVPVKPDPILVDPTPVPPQLPAGHLDVQAQLDRSAVLQGQAQDRFLLITLRAPADIGQSFHRAVDLGVVMDVSGSMQARGKIDYAKKGATLLVDSMASDDTYSLVTFSDEATVVVPASTVTNPWPVHQAIDAIWEGGGTNLYAGLDKGASEVHRSLKDGQIGRVILLSDGKANKGIVDPEAMGRLVSTLAAQGVTVSTIGLGAEYNEDLMQRLADLGGGTYDYVDDPQELTAAFSDELQRSASVVARGTRVQIHLPAGVEPVEVLGWDADKTPDGFSLYMGDVYAGDARKVIARVRVTGATTPRMDVARVKVDYEDLVDGHQAEALADATAQTTTDVATVEASADRDTVVEAVRAWGNDILVESTRAFNDGDKTRARTLAHKSQEVLNDAATRYNAPTLAKDAEKGAAQAQVYEEYEPSAAPAQSAIKATKEYYNTQSRSLMVK